MEGLVMKDIDTLYQSVKCPYCLADVGKPCRTESGRFTEHSHKMRRDLYGESVRTGLVEAPTDVPIEIWNI